MKTIANIIIINSQNVKSEHLLAVIITSVFKEESSESVSALTSSTEVVNSGLPKLPLDYLKSLRHWLAEPHPCTIQVIAWNISECMQFSTSVAIFDVHACATICDCLSENPPSSHLLVFREIPF